MKGNITISRVTGTCGTTCRITIGDELSMQSFLEIELDFEALGLAITGLGQQPVEYELHASDHLGKKIEHKRVKVVIDTSRFDGDWSKSNPKCIEFIKQEVKPLEIDGWECQDTDGVFNHHVMYHITNDLIETSLSFYRWLEVK